MPTDQLEAPPAPPPSKGPAPVTADVAGARAAKVEIRASDMTPAQLLSNAPRPGSARAAMSESLAKIAKNPDGSAPTPPAQEAQPKVPDALAPKEGEEPGEQTPEGEAETPEGQTPPAETTDPKAKKAKVNPWRLADDYKARLHAAEAKLAELTKVNVAPEVVKQVTEKLTATEKRVQELEAEMRHSDFSKTEEFKKEYQVPYEQAWKRSMTELSELTVTDTNGNERPFGANDMLQLVQLSLPKAHALAEELFGTLAGEVMSHRMEIKRLFDKQATALSDARTKGDEFFKGRAAQTELKTKELNGFIAQTWTAENEALTKHPKHGANFTPQEGDDEGNAALAKGFKLTDEAMAQNPNDPSLTPEQRADIVKKHAALRNRSAAYGKVVKQRDRALAKLKEYEDKEAALEKSTPDTNGRESAPSGSAATSAKDAVFGALRKLAK